MKLNKIEDEGKWSEHTTRLNSNFNKINQGVESLNSTYRALTQSDVLVVSTLPQQGVANTIYRVVGNGSYSDYMYNSDDLTTPILMATYNNAIDLYPQEGSENLITSGAVYESYANQVYLDDQGEASIPDFNPQSDSVWSHGVQEISAANQKQVRANLGFGDGDIDEVPTIGSDNLVKSGGVAETYGEYVENPEWIKVITDNDGKILCGIKNDGSIEWSVGVPTPVVEYIQNKISELSLDEYEDIVAFLGNLIEGDNLATILANIQSSIEDKVDKVEDKSLIDENYAENIEYIESPEFIKVYTDSQNKILFGITTDGNVVFGKGIPIQIENYVQDSIDEIMDGSSLTTAIDHINEIYAFLDGFTTSDVLKSYVGKYIEQPQSIEIKTDAEDKIISYRDTDGVLHENSGIATTHLNVSEEIDLDEQAKEAFLSELDTYWCKDKELFTIGDSLSAGGVWQEKTKQVATGLIFDQTKNIKAGSMLSCGGTETSGGDKLCGLSRVTNLKKENYSPDIIVLQNVNDIRSFNSDGTPKATAGSITDKPYIISQYLEGYSYDDWQSDPASLLSNIPVLQRKFGTAIEMLHTISGEGINTNVKITTLPSVEGDVILKVTTTQTGTVDYGIHVLPTDSIANIVEKILEYNYGNVIDTKGDDNESVDFTIGSTTYNVTVAFQDVGNTGMQVLITQTNTAKVATYRFFDGGSLSNDWADSSKWIATIPFYRAWKGVIEFCQINYPNALTIMLLMPYNSKTSDSYKYEDGTYNQNQYVEDKAIIEGLYTEQAKIANLYRIPIIDAHHNIGISCANYSTYYNYSNVHPKTAGYYKAGNYIAKQIINLI